MTMKGLGKMIRVRERGREGKRRSEGRGVRYLA